MMEQANSSDPRARRMIGELALALGGLHRLSEIKAVACSGSLKLITTSPVHVCGYWECAWTVAGQFRSTVWLPGDIRVRTVFDASTGKGWVLEADDSVQPLPPEECAEIRGLLYLLSLDWLRPGGIPGMVLAERDADASELLMRPAEGSPCTVLCGETGLPRTLEWTAPVAKRGLHPRLLAARLGLKATPPADGPRITELGDWGDVDGYGIPRQVAEKLAGGPEYIYFPEKVEFNPSLPPDYFDRPVPPPPDIQFPDGAHSVTLPFDLIESRIVLQVGVNGQGPFPFLLDSGTSASMLDINLAKRLGIPLRCSFEGNLGGGSGVTKVDLAEGVCLQLGGLESRTHNIMAMAINHKTETYAGFETLGFLGGDFIGRFVVEVDYEKRTVSLHDVSRPPSGLQDSLPIQVSSGVPMVNATLSVSGRRLETTLMMDTGAGWAVVLNQPFVQAENLGGDITPTIDTVTFGVSGAAPLALGRVTALQLGAPTVDQPVAALALEASGTLGDSSFSGILGAETLRRLLVRLDYRRATFSFETNPLMAVPIEYEMSGLVLRVAPGGEAFQVAFVVADSPAEQAGVREQDQIVEIDGRPVTKWTLPEFLALCRVPDRELRLGLRRGGKTMATEFRTRKLI